MQRDKLMIKHEQFWTGQRGLDNIKPKRTGSNWESFNALDVAKRLCGGTTCVNDIGCGTGRMAAKFDELAYVGYDLNPAAIEVAEREFPGHSFAVLVDYADIEPVNTFLFHSSALHIPDDELVTLSKRAGHKMVIAETMHGSRRAPPNPKDGLATHYSRSPNDYVNLFAPWWVLKHTETHTDAYSRKVFTYLVFER